MRREQPRVGGLSNAYAPGYRDEVGAYRRNLEEDPRQIVVQLPRWELSGEVHFNSREKKGIPRKSFSSLPEFLDFILFGKTFRIILYSGKQTVWTLSGQSTED